MNNAIKIKHSKMWYNLNRSSFLLGCKKWIKNPYIWEDGTANILNLGCTPVTIAFFQNPMSSTGLNSIHNPKIDSTATSLLSSQKTKRKMTFACQPTFSNFRILWHKCFKFIVLPKHYTYIEKDTEIRFLSIAENNFVTKDAMRLTTNDP